MGRVVISARLILGLFLLGAGVGGLLTWLLITWRAIGTTRVPREAPRMIALPPAIAIDYAPVNRRLTRDLGSRPVGGAGRVQS